MCTFNSVNQECQRSSTSSIQTSRARMMPSAKRKPFIPSCHRPHQRGIVGRQQPGNADGKEVNHLTTSAPSALSESTNRELSLSWITGRGGKEGPHIHWCKFSKSPAFPMGNNRGQKRAGKVRFHVANAIFGDGWIHLKELFYQMAKNSYQDTMVTVKQQILCTWWHVHVNVLYVGETKRQFKTRIKEHIFLSLNGKMTTTMSKHIGLTHILIHQSLNSLTIFPRI